VIPVSDIGEAETAAREYAPLAGSAPQGFEIVLVHTGDATPTGVPAAEGIHVEMVPAPGAGWGRSIRAGLEAAGGDLLCYTSQSRTSPEALRQVLASARAFPASVVRVNRRSRDSLAQRVGSLLYNAECRRLYGLPVWDVNGTPKAFPREFDRLLALRSDDELFDLEFSVACQANGYPVVEVPVAASSGAAMGLATAARLYWRAFRSRRELGG
jgi:hypothetical protein